MAERVTVDGGADYPFPIDEYQQRLAKLREGMKGAGVDILLVTSPENIYYLTGYHTTGHSWYQGLFVRLDGEPQFVLRSLDFTAVAKLSWVKSGYPVGDGESHLEATLSGLRSMGGGTARIGYDQKDLHLPAEIIDGLRVAFGHERLVPAFGLVERCKLIKSPRELSYIRQACAIVTEGLRAGIPVMRPGATENQVAGTIYHAMVTAGSEYMSTQPYVVTGGRNPPRRTMFEGNVIKRGHAIWFEASASVRRYGGAIMRTFSVGPPSRELRKAADVMLAALDAMLAAAKPGVACGDVDRAGRSIVAESGYGEHWLHRSGYSIGISFPPSWTEGEVIDLKPDDPRVLQPGMAFHLIPYILLPGIGAVGFSETFAVTENGIDVFTDFPRELRIL